MLSSVAAAPCILVAEGMNSMAWTVAASWAAGGAREEEEGSRVSLPLLVTKDSWVGSSCCGGLSEAR